MKKLFSYLAIFCYLISFFIILYCIKARLILNINVRLILLSIVCLLIYIGGLLLVKKLNYNKKILKVNLIIYFLIYTVTIFSLTLFDEIYGRQGLIIIDWNKQLLDSYLKTSFNIIPFNTIILFIKGYINGYISFNSFFVNVIGNFLAFMPYAVFFPLIFKNMNKYYKFLLTMMSIIIIIEVLQFVTISGSFDIDDLILNLFGTSLIYLITKINCINKLIHKIFLFK